MANRKRRKRKAAHSQKREQPAAVAENTLTRAITMRADTARDTDQSIEAVITTDSPVKVFDPQRGEILDEVLLTAGANLPQAISLTTDHDFSVKSVIGTTGEFKRLPHEIRGRNFFDSDDDATKLYSKSKARSITDNSIEYRTDAFIYLEPGQAKNINGKRYTAGQDRPLKIATQWALIRNSLVLQGADPAAKMRQKIGVLPMISTEKLTWLRSQGYTPEEMTDDQKRDALAAYTTEPAPAPAPEPDNSLALLRAQADAKAGAIKDEKERVAEARQMGKDCPLPAHLVDQMIDNGWPAIKMRDAALAHLSGAQRTINAPMIGSGGVTPTKEHYLANVALRGNQGTDEAWIEKRFKPDVVEQAREIYKPMTINQGNIYAQAAELAFRENDQPVPFTTNVEQLVRSALENRAVAASTMALPKILSDTATVSVLRGYQAATGSWRPWCVIGSLGDFLTHRRAGAHVLGEPQKVTGAGQIEHTA